MLTTHQLPQVSIVTDICYFDDPVLLTFGLCYQVSARFTFLVEWYGFGQRGRAKTSHCFTTRVNAGPTEYLRSTSLNDISIVTIFES